MHSGCYDQGHMALLMNRTMSVFENQVMQNKLLLHKSVHKSTQNSSKRLKDRLAYGCL